MIELPTWVVPASVALCTAFTGLSSWGVSTLISIEKDIATLLVLQQSSTERIGKLEMRWEQLNTRVEIIAAEAEGRQRAQLPPSRR